MECAFEANAQIYSLKATSDGAIILGTGYGTQAFTGEGDLLWEHYPENQTSPSYDCST